MSLVPSYRFCVQQHNEQRTHGSKPWPPPSYTSLSFSPMRSTDHIVRERQLPFHVQSSIDNFIYLFGVQRINKNEFTRGRTVTAFFGQIHASKARPRLMLFCVYIHSFTGISLKSSAIYLCHLLQLTMNWYADA